MTGFEFTYVCHGSFVSLPLDTNTFRQFRIKNLDITDSQNIVLQPGNELPFNSV